MSGSTHKIEPLEAPSKIIEVTFAGTTYNLKECAMKELRYLLAAGFRGDEHKAIYHEYMDRKKE